MRHSFWREIRTKFDPFLSLFAASIATIYVAGRLSYLNRMVLLRVEALALWVQVALALLCGIGFLHLVVHSFVVAFERKVSRERGAETPFWRRPSWWMPFFIGAGILGSFLLFDKGLRPVYFSSHLWAKTWRQLYWFYLAKRIFLIVLAVVGGLLFQLLYRLCIKQGRRVVSLLSIGCLVLAAIVAVVWISPPLPILPSADPDKRIEVVSTGVNILVVTWDGATWSVLDRLRQTGQVPTLEKLMKAGAYGSLASLRATSQAAIWTSLVTGMRPKAHSVHAEHEYAFPLIGHSIQSHTWGAETRLLNGLCRASLYGIQPFFFLEILPASSGRSRHTTLWELVREAGRKDYHVGLFNCFGTTPAEMVPGFIFSDQFFEQYSSDRLAGDVRDATAYPSTLYWDLPEAELGAKLQNAWQALEEYRGPYKQNVQGMANVDRDRFFANLAPAVLSAMRPKLTLVTFYGTQSLGAHFWPYWEPQYFPDVFRQEVSRYHDILPGYYQYLDNTLSELMTAVGPQTTVFVVSGYGMEPAIGAPDGRRACHGNATPGVLVAYGDSIRQGFGWVERAELVDLAPTMLYLLGFPISNELDGRVLTEIVKEDFLMRHPIRQIPSYGPRMCITP